MNIKIKNLTDVIELISDDKRNYNIVSIRSSMHADIMYEEFNTFKDNYNDIIVETFDDITTPRNDLIIATIGHIQSILVWAKGKDNILVHCDTSMSRSSAVAYLIKCLTTPPHEAMKILDIDLHYPNELVVRIGSQLFNNPHVIGHILQFNNISGDEAKHLISKKSL